MTISLPFEMHRAVKAEVKNGRYASVSEFFRALLRFWEEERILRDVRQSKKEFAQGKGKLLRSFDELDD